MGRTEFDTTPERSELMSKIRSKNTKPELLLKDPLESLGFDYQPKIAGNPDFADTDTKVTIFVDGCFWHVCPQHFKMPKKNPQYWGPKFIRNMERDTETTKKLVNDGWLVIRIWEHSITKDTAEALGKIVDLLGEAHVYNHKIGEVRI